MGKIYNKIKDTLISIAQELSDNGSDRDWTKEIKQKLAELGESKGFDICTSGFEDAYSGEWLYDLVWYKNNNKGYLESLELIVESEWKRELSDIKYDFEKLLVSNAKHRLFICQAKPDFKEELEKYFRDAIDNYKQLSNNFSVLVAILDDYNTGEFIINLYSKKATCQNV